MSTFKVEQTRIEKIWEHSNADKLELAKVEGIDLQFVIGKGIYEVGTKVLYFPLDAVLPDALIEHLELTGRLSGKQHNRIKTLRLRGEISQGFVCSVEKIKEYSHREKFNLNDIVYLNGGYDGPYHEIDWTSTLKIEKYEPEDIPCQNGVLKPLLAGVSVYDIEGIERYPEVVELLWMFRVSLLKRLKEAIFM
jgi:RNA ligase (TIGR02306 family)